MKEIHSTAHWEAMRGTVDQAAEYCKKEGDWFEAGTKPLNQVAKGERGKLAIQEGGLLLKLENTNSSLRKTSRSTSS